MCSSDLVTSAKRAAAMPDLPAIAETLAGYDVANWYGLATPKNVSKQIVTKIHAEVLRVLQQPELRQAFEREAIDVIGSSPEVFGEYLKSELVKWGGLVKSSGMKVE